MTTTDYIKYESNTVSNGLNTIFATSAGKTVLYEGVPIVHTEPVLPNSLFIEPNFNKIFVDIFLPCDYKIFNNKVVVAYFKDGTKEKAVVQDVL